MKLSSIIILLVAGVFAIAAGWIYQSQTSTSAVKPELEIPVDIDYYLSKVTYKVMNDEGNLDYRLRSPYLQHFKREDISRLDAPEIDIYRNNEHWRVKANSAEMRHEENILNLVNDVAMEKVGDRPVIIKADKAVFDMNTNVYLLTNTKSIYYHESS